MKRGQRQVFKLEKLQNHSDEGKGEEKKKERGEGREEKRKKSMVALPVFITATLEIVFGRKKLLDTKRPFGNKVFKNRARY